MMYCDLILAKKEIRKKVPKDEDNYIKGYMEEKEGNHL